MGTGFAALFIGVQHYDQGDPHFPRLGAPIKDAGMMRTFYGEHFGGPDNEFRLVVAGAKKPSPTLDDLQKQIDALKMACPTAVVLFFSGHGLELDGKPYLAMSNATISNSSVEGVISLEKLAADLRFAEVETVALILDACRWRPVVPAGSWPSVAKQMENSANFASALEGFTAKHPDVAILSSCSSGQLSFETVSGGKFTIALLDVLNELVSNRERVVGELLCEYTNKRFAKVWPDTPQNPSYFRNGPRSINFVPPLGPPQAQPRELPRQGELILIKVLRRAGRRPRFAITIFAAFLALLALGTLGFVHHMSAPTVDGFNDEAKQSIRSFQDDYVKKSTGFDANNSFTDERLRQWRENGTAGILAQTFVHGPEGTKLVRELESLPPWERDQALEGLDALSKPTFNDVGRIPVDGSAQTDAGQKAERELAQEITGQIRGASSGLMPRLFWWLYIP